MALWYILIYNIYFVLCICFFSNKTDDVLCLLWKNLLTTWETGATGGSVSDKIGCRCDCDGTFMKFQFYLIPRWELSVTDLSIGLSGCSLLVPAVSSLLSRAPLQLRPRTPHSSLLSSVAQPASLPHCSPCCSSPSLHSSTASLASLQTRNIFLSAASFLILIPLCSNVNRASVRLYQKISKYKNHFNESLEIQ